MLAVGAEEGAGAGVGEGSAARDMLVVAGGRGDCYWRMDVVWEKKMVLAAEGRHRQEGGAMETAVKRRGVCSQRSRWVDGGRLRYQMRSRDGRMRARGRE
jgi:hypothetical protein